MGARSGHCLRTVDCIRRTRTVVLKHPSRTPTLQVFSPPRDGYELVGTLHTAQIAERGC